MAPKTIAIRRREVDPVSPIRDDIRSRPSRGSKNSNSNRSGRTTTTNRSDTGHYARSGDGIMMDPAEHDAWRRLGGETQAYATTTEATVTTATAEETVTTRSTSSTSAGSSTTRQLRQSVKKHERELEDLKEKYEEAKSKMSKMKQEKSTNKKMLLEMSGLIKSLQEISVDYEQTKKDNKDDDSSRHRSHLKNVQRKIQAIDTQMRAAKTQCGMLEEEKSIHTTTIKAQETQISALEGQIQFLVQRLEQQTESNTQGQSELERIIQLQETQIWSLEGQIGLLKRNAKERKIDSIEQQNAKRYQEIDALEDKLAALREAQNAHKIQASLIRTMSKSQDEDEAEEEEMIEDEAIFEEDASDIKSLEKESSIAKTTTKEQDASVSKSTARAKKSFGKSARKKRAGFGNVSVTSGSTTLSAIEEENETSSEATSVPGTSRTSASETTRDVTTMDGDDEASSDSSEDDSSTEDSTTTGAESSTYASSVLQERTGGDKKRSVTLEPSEDGSVEVMSLQEREAVKMSDVSVNTSDSSVYVGDVDENKPEEAQLEQQQEKDADESQRKKRRIMEELEEAKSKYENLKNDYNSVVSTSTNKMQLLEEEKKELLECQARALASAAEVTESSSANIAKLQKENDQLRKSVAQKEALLSLSETKLDNLRTEHTQTMLELKGKDAKNDDLFSSDSSSYDDQVVDLETYTRLEKVHEAVVMKLADLGEDNDRLEREQAATKEQLENMYTQLQSHDEIVLELQKLKRAFRLVEEERDAAVSKMERMEDRKRVMQNSSEETANLRQELADSLARIEVLEKTNEEFLDVESKYTASEVRVTVLEEELETAKQKTKEQKKKLAERELQIREVIGQYKTLKQDHAQSQTRVKRLEKVVESDKQIAVNTTKSVGVSESARTERTSSSAEFSATKMAAMTSQLVAYEGQINKLQSQRDAALEEMKEMEEDLQKAKDESATAVEAKKTREKDLRIVLQHYEKLQKKYEATSKEFGEMTQKYEETVRKIDGLEDKINGKDKKSEATKREVEQLPNWDAENSGESKQQEKHKKEVSLQIPALTTEEAPTIDSQFVPAANAEQSSEQNNIDDDAGSIEMLLHEMEDLKRQKDKKACSEDTALEADDIKSISDAKETVPPSKDPPSRIDYDDAIKELQAAKESSDWKNEKIARVLCDLKAAHEEVETLEREKSDLQSDLNLLKGHLLIAQRESATAKERQENREVSLRNAIAKHHRLQQAYESLDSKFNEVQEQLNAAQNETRRKEEEAKAARIRASGVHAQYKKLQVDHSAVLDRLERLKQKLEVYETTPGF